MSTDDRNRLSFIFVDWHTGQEHATTGTPCEVPDPKKVTFIKLFNIRYGKGTMIVLPAVKFLLFLHRNKRKLFWL